MFSLVWSYRLSRAVLVCWGSRLHQLPRAHSGLVWGVERGLLSFPGLSHIGGSSPSSSPTDGTIGWCYASRRYPLYKLSSRTAIPFSFIPREFPALPGLFINKYRSLLYNSNVTFSSFSFSSYLSEWVIPFFGWKKALKNSLLWKAPHRGTNFLLCVTSSKDWAWTVYLFNQIKTC